jgi:hypothetical protein
MNRLKQCSHVHPFPGKSRAFLAVSPDRATALGASFANQEYTNGAVSGAARLDAMSTLRYCFHGTKRQPAVARAGPIVYDFGGRQVRR